ncbi:hypothetical protein MMA53_24920 [Salmonella enterica]|nr:hypothetical protein [Salmonella enterica]
MAVQHYPDTLVAGLFGFGPKTLLLMS